MAGRDKHAKNLTGRLVTGRKNSHAHTMKNLKSWAI